LAFPSHTPHDNWQVFKDATLFFSHSTPNLATIIPAMDHIDEMLTMSSLNSTYPPSICAMLSIAKKTSNHYYNATDQSKVYQIAMSEYCIFIHFSVKLIMYGVIVALHPRHKLKYFECAGWEPQWIAAVKDIVWDEFNCSYAAKVVDIEEDQDEDIEMGGLCSSNIFDNLPSLSAPRTRELRDKLDRYLSTDPEHVVDVLMWWTERKLMYLHLSHMTLDYLSIPGEFYAV
jgi:hypothetical protein